MGCIVPTPGHGLYRPNTWTVLYCILRLDSGYIIPTSYNITICRTFRAGQRAWLPLASMPLINQRGQYKSDIIAADAVGSAFQCIFNTFHLSNLIIDGKNVTKYQRHICGWPKRGLHSLPWPQLKSCIYWPSMLILRQTGHVSPPDLGPFKGHIKGTPDSESHMGCTVPTTMDLSKNIGRTVPTSILPSMDLLKIFEKQAWLQVHSHSAPKSISQPAIVGVSLWLWGGQANSILQGLYK